MYAFSAATSASHADEGILTCQQYPRLVVQGEVKANPYMEEKFTYYKKEWNEEDQKYNVKKYTLSGYFEQANEVEEVVSFNDVEGMPAPECHVKMNFVALDEDEGQNNEYWDDTEIEF